MAYTCFRPAPTLNTVTGRSDAGDSYAETQINKLISSVYFLIVILTMYRINLHTDSAFSIADAHEGRHTIVHIYIEQVSRPTVFKCL